MVGPVSSSSIGGVLTTFWPSSRGAAYTNFVAEAEVDRPALGWRCRAGAPPLKSAPPVVLCASAPFDGAPARRRARDGRDVEPTAAPRQEAEAIREHRHSILDIQANARPSVPGLQAPHAEQPRLMVARLNSPTGIPPSINTPSIHLADRGRMFRIDQSSAAKNGFLVAILYSLIFLSLPSSTCVATEFLLHSTCPPAACPLFLQRTIHPSR